MSELYFLIPSLEVTNTLGQMLGSLAGAGDVICLDGDLGAGKTTFSQALARGAGVAGDCYVTSPSFAILHEYPARLPIYHMDFYRLEDYTEVEDLGFDEYFYGSGLCIIEWALRAEEILPKVRLHLFFSLAGDNKRKICCRYDRTCWEKRLLTALEQCGCTIIEK